MQECYQFVQPKFKYLPGKVADTGSMELESKCLDTSIIENVKTFASNIPNFLKVQPLMSKNLIKR